MKKIDLEAALNGEPVKLACGRKAYILYDLSKYPELSKCEKQPLVGFVMHDDRWGKCYQTNWFLDGTSSYCMNNIIGMWKDPKISIEDLPKPFYPEESNDYFYISDGKVNYNLFHSKYSESSMQIVRNGQCFRKEEDAQKWIDFMKSMME